MRMERLLHATKHNIRVSSSNLRLVRRSSIQLIQPQAHLLILVDHALNILKEIATEDFKMMVCEIDRKDVALVLLKRLSR